MRPVLLLDRQVHRQTHDNITRFFGADSASRPSADARGLC